MVFKGKGDVIVTTNSGGKLLINIIITFNNINQFFLLKVREIVQFNLEHMLNLLDHLKNLLCGLKKRQFNH